MNDIDDEIEVFEDESNNSLISKNQNNPNERPLMLKVLCILSWIYAGLSLFSLLIYKLIVSDEIKEKMYEVMNSDQQAVDVLKEQFNYIDNTSTWLILLFLLEIFFVYMIWGLKKSGFMGYVIVQILLVLVNFIVLPFNYSVFFNLSITPMIFIFLYGVNLKHMKA